MLTVLVRYKKTRIEVLMPATTVEFFPESDGNHDAGLLVINDSSGQQSRHLPLSEKSDENWRDVFVMNASGSTVARYVL